MNKLILTGVLIVSGLPLLAVAAEGTSGMSQTTIDYITKLNCDAFTGDSKTFCLEKKKQVLQNQQNAGNSTPQSPSQPTQNDQSSSTPKANPEMSQTAMDYIMKLNCDTFTGDSKTYCLEKKKQAMQNQQSMPQGGSQGGMSGMPPPRDGSGSMDRKPPRPEGGSGTMNGMPPRDMMKGSGGMMMGKPPRDGSGSMDRKPPRQEGGSGTMNGMSPKQGSGMLNTPPRNDGIGAAVEQLSEADRIELMKVIRSFLESKGIKVTLTSEKEGQNNSQNSNSGSSSEEMKAKMNAKREMLKPKKTAPSTTTTNMQ